MDSELLNWVIQHGYIIMFLVMLVEGPVITASGALAAALGYYDVFVVFALSFFANFLPDVFYYSVGHWGGNRALDKYGERFGIARTRRDRTAGFLSRHMGKWLIFIKTVPFLSPPGLAVMGALGVPVRRFIWLDVLIVALTSLFFVVIGYYSGKGYDFLQGATQYGPWGLAGAFLFIILLTQLFGRLARRFTRRIRTFAVDEIPTTQV
jgi:membrane protein DedA with SNARE-associated domain